MNTWDEDYWGSRMPERVTTRQAYRDRLLQIGKAIIGAVMLMLFLAIALLGVWLG